jgi:chromosomal replication initiator protein
MPDAVIEHLAVNSLHSIRQLLGNFTKVSAAADFLSKPITLSLAETFIPSSSAPSLGLPRLTIQPSQVINAVADYYHIPLTAITGRTRDKSATGARQVAAYLLMEVLQLSQSAIGVALGGRDPATIRYSLKKVSRLISTSPSFLNTLSRIQTTLRERQ